MHFFRRLHASVFETNKQYGMIWLYKDPGVFGKEWMWEVSFCAAVLLYWDLLKESSTTSVNCATQHKRPPLQLYLPAYYVFNESLTVFKRNRQVSEWQIAPMHRQPLDDYHGKLTTG